MSRLVIQKRSSVIGNSFFSFRINVLGSDTKIAGMKIWCSVNLVQREWAYHDARRFFAFKAEGDAVLFRLKFE